ncbi:MAG: hypothetical protein JO113_00655 [Candidatus Eremiobacteraeota bacterium]|nr:hypothetical protein [Candidatus Eremiobacteraeota bacterium]
MYGNDDRKRFQRADPFTTNPNNTVVITVFGSTRQDAEANATQWGYERLGYDKPDNPTPSNGDNYDDQRGDGQGDNGGDDQGDGVGEGDGNGGGGYGGGGNGGGGNGGGGDEAPE